MLISPIDGSLTNSAGNLIAHLILKRDTKFTMSRRAPNAAADRAAQNQQTIKSLLKLEGNKNCADCKRNKRMCYLFKATYAYML